MYFDLQMTLFYLKLEMFNFLSIWYIYSMGILHRYKCNNCKYNIYSPSDIDYGMMAVTEPYICLDCKKVTSVLIGSYGNIYSSYCENLNQFSKEEIATFYKCGDCEGENIKTWSKYNRRCPKCNKRMYLDEKSGEILWD